MINHVGNLLQRDGNQDAHVLADDQIVHANQFGCIGVVFGVLDCNRCLPKWHADRDVVHRQLEAHYVFDGHDVSVILLIK